MDNQKKILIKCTAFLLVLVLLFLCIQEVLREKLEHEYDYLEARYESLISQYESGMEVDVLYCGSSPIYAGIAPMIMWEEHGYTGMNLGTNTQNAMAVYYSLLYVLEYGTPKVVVLDFNDINEKRLPNVGTNNRATTLKQLYTIKNPKIRLQYMKEIAKATGSLDIFIPIAEFHERWDALTPLDFGEITYSYEEYAKGSLLSRDTDPLLYEDAYDAEYENVKNSEFSTFYYEKIIDLCRSNDISLVGLAAPKVVFENRLGQYKAIEDFCADYNIPYFNYNDPSLLSETNINAKTDYKDAGHLNVLGAIKLSRSFGGKLKELYDLPDRRTDSVYASWNADMQKFHEDYAEEISMSKTGGK